MLIIGRASSGDFFGITPAFVCRWNNLSKGWEQFSPINVAFALVVFFADIWEVEITSVTPTWRWLMDLSLPEPSCAADGLRKVSPFWWSCRFYDYLVSENKGGASQIPVPHNVIYVDRSLISIEILVNRSPWLVLFHSGHFLAVITKSWVITNMAVITTFPGS